MQIELAVNSACRVENAAGQSLTFRNGAWEGDMAASSVSVNGFDDTTMTLEIPYTEALHYTHESGESRFSRAPGDRRAFCFPATGSMRFALHRIR